MEELREVTVGEITAQVTQALPHHPDRVWQAFADFGAIADWHPLIASSDLEGAEPVSCPGVVRVLRTTGQDGIREEMVDCDATERRLTYRFLDSPFPVSGYLATVHVRQGVGHRDASVVTWRATFRPDAPTQGSEMADLFANQVFAVGLTALSAHLRTRS